MGNPIVGLVILFILICVVISYRIYVDSKRRKMWVKEDTRRCIEKRKQAILDDLRNAVHYAFCVELDTIHESYTQEEIVRVVNLLAYQTAVACVNEDKIGRGEGLIKTEVVDWRQLTNHGFSWSEFAKSRKIEWSNRKKLALKIAPELTDRMPHFSEFEPLKSYNAERLRKKAEKRAAAK